MHNIYSKKLTKLGIKFLTINSHFQDLETAYVDVDDFSGGYKLTNYLISLGHKKIAGIFKTDDIQGINRRNGYIKALESNNIELDETMISEFTAIVCYNDEITINTIKICKELNITPVKDLSIVSFDNSEILSSLAYTITNIPHPKAELGKKAAQFIIEMIEGKAYKPKYTFKANLIIGNSCTPPQ